jgi:hypothetical protein
LVNDKIPPQTPNSQKNKPKWFITLNFSFNGRPPNYDSGLIQFETQIKEIAHNIRNAKHNEGTKRLRLYPI